jgi:hypothetical protein
MYPIASTTVGAGNQNNLYIFSSIPQTFTHLQVRIFARSTASATTDYFGFAYNNDLANTYYYLHYLQGNGGSATSGYNNSVGSIDIAAGNALANVFTVAIADILDYSNTNKNKTQRILDGHDFNGSGRAELQSRLYTANTNAISSISFFTSTNFAIGTRFDLYGISTSNVTGA